MNRLATNQAKMLVSTLLEPQSPSSIESNMTLGLQGLQSEVDVISIAKSFGASRIVRKLRLQSSQENSSAEPVELRQSSGQVYWKDYLIGTTTLLYKSPLPGELQARLAVESTIERYLEYLQRVHHIALLEESDRHVNLFIPRQDKPDFNELWKDFVEKVAFSIYGDSRHQLPGLMQTFVLMMNSVTLSERGFSTIDVPIVTNDQANILAALYYAVFRQTHKRQVDRQIKIVSNIEKLTDDGLSEKEETKLKKEISRDEEMQLKEAEKYKKNFQKFVIGAFSEQAQLWQDIHHCESKLSDENLNQKDRKACQKKLNKATKGIVFSEIFVRQRLVALSKNDGDPFASILADKSEHRDLFEPVIGISKRFKKTATDQISATKGDIFSKCLLEMYRLIDDPIYVALPSLLTEQPDSSTIRSAGDDSRDFCYSCGRSIDAKSSWKVARFMFERPYQRRQSSANEGQPPICNSCAALSFISPVKVSDKSIILRLEARSQSEYRQESSEQLLKEYIRMMTSKEVHLQSGRYVVIAADRTGGGDTASQKLGKLQFALAKIASTFPIEVLKSLRFSLFMQSSEPIALKGRSLVFIKALMDSYYQPIVLSGKEVNLKLGEAIRKIQQDSPYLAEYILLPKSPANPDQYALEQAREIYGEMLRKEVETDIGVDMETLKRARRYQDVAALTGLLFPFAKKLDKEPQAKGQKEKEKEQKSIDREISKLIEQVVDATSFCYYATLGVENKERVQAALFKGQDTHFIYEQAKALLKTIKVENSEEREIVDPKKSSTRLTLHADDISKAYSYFAENGYSTDREWKELTYQLKLSLYTRFPRLVRKQKTTGDN